eukprot:5406093-Prymnesium_polylepis.1
MCIRDSTHVCESGRRERLQLAQQRALIVEGAPRAHIGRGGEQFEQHAARRLAIAERERRGEQRAAVSASRRALEQCQLRVLRLRAAAPRRPHAPFSGQKRRRECRETRARAHKGKPSQNGAALPRWSGCVYVPRRAAAAAGAAAAARARSARAAPHALGIGRARLRGRGVAAWRPAAWRGTPATRQTVGGR